jgi:hypothetical protein
MLRKIVIALSMMWIVWGCATSQHGSGEQGERGAAPVIIGHYAAEAIRPGATWRVYLHAKDDDGDSKDIACVLEQRGHSSYPTSVTRLRTRHGEEVAGYLFLRTPVDSNLTKDSFTMKVLVRDGQGNRSEPLEFPLRVAYVPTEEIPEKWQEMADRRLGSIQVEVKSSIVRSRTRRNP